MGEGVGWRVLDLLAIRDRSIKRELRLVAMLSYIQVSAWKALFGRSADSLEQSIDHDDECMTLIMRHQSRHLLSLLVWSPLVCSSCLLAFLLSASLVPSRLSFLASLLPLFLPAFLPLSLPALPTRSVNSVTKGRM